MNQPIPSNVYLAPVNLQQAPTSNGSGRRRRRKNRDKKKKEKKKTIWKTWELWTVIALTSIIWGPILAWIQSKALVLGLLILHDAAENVSKALGPIAQ